MPPKIRITKENVIHTAVDIVRKKGADVLNARGIALQLGCSTQPIFSNFATMEELKLAVVNEANALYRSYCKREIEQSEFPPYKASGMAYIRFAEEEKELFKLLFMRNRSGEKIIDNSDDLNEMCTIIQNNIALSKEDASMFHFEMWVYVHGIATMIATDYLEFDWDLISRMLTDSYQGLKKRYEEKE